MTSRVGFVRWAKTDSKFDLICLSCFRTIATMTNETDALTTQETHICDPKDLSQRRQNGGAGTFPERIISFLGKKTA
jgi:hypothetical protein